MSVSGVASPRNQKTPLIQSIGRVFYCCLICSQLYRKHTASGLKPNSVVRRRSVEVGVEVPMNRVGAPSRCTARTGDPVTDGTPQERRKVAMAATGAAHMVYRQEYHA